MIFQLVEERKLKLTDTLDKFLPQVPNAQKITIAQILAHRSGIHDSLLDRNLRPSSKTDPITKNELLTLIAQGKPDFEPDAKHSYSNSGYILSGLILEKLTGKPYGEALKERITSKIGLNDTYTATGNIDVNKNEALTYRYVAMFGLLDYRDRRHGRLHSPRAARMTEKSPVTPIAIMVQTKKKCPLELAMLLVTPTPFPLMWARGTTNEKSPPRRVMM